MQNLRESGCPSTLLRSQHRKGQRMSSEQGGKTNHQGAGGGLPRNQRKYSFQTRYSLTRKRVVMLKEPDMDRLDGCMDDSARRLLLGKSELFTPEELAVAPLTER